MEIVGTHEPAHRYYDFTICKSGRALRIMARFEGMEIFGPGGECDRLFSHVNHRMTGMNGGYFGLAIELHYLMSITDKADRYYGASPPDRGVVVMLGQHLHVRSIQFELNRQTFP